MADERDPGEPGETPKERADRELTELLNEFRVVLPGITVMFGFLLAVPFANGWKRTDEFQHDVFIAAFLATGLAVAFLVAETSYHRLRFRAGNKSASSASATSSVSAGSRPSASPSSASSCS